MAKVVMATVPVKPFNGDTVRVAVPVCPVQNGTIVELATKPKSTTEIGKLTE